MLRGRGWPDYFMRVEVLSPLEVSLLEIWKSEDGLVTSLVFLVKSKPICCSLNSRVPFELSRHIFF